MFCFCFSCWVDDKGDDIENKVRRKCGGEQKREPKPSIFLIDKTSIVPRCCLWGLGQKSLVLVFYSPKLLYIFTILQCMPMCSLASWKGVLPLWLFIYPWGNESEQCLLSDRCLTQLLFYSLARFLSFLFLSVLPNSASSKSGLVEEKWCDCHILGHTQLLWVRSALLIWLPTSYWSTSATIASSKRSSGWSQRWTEAGYSTSRTHSWSRPCSVRMYKRLCWYTAICLREVFSGEIPSVLLGFFPHQVTVILPSTHSFLWSVVLPLPYFCVILSSTQLGKSFIIKKRMRHLHVTSPRRYLTCYINVDHASKYFLSVGWSSQLLLLGKHLFPAKSFSLIRFCNENHGYHVTELDQVLYWWNAIHLYVLKSHWYLWTKFCIW